MAARALNVSLFVNMATGYTKEWIQFFNGCGIPDDVSTMYALIFYENRIQKNMLPDLNKEYLRDMGITVMGDVIAILRHAKIVHEKYIREKILSVEDNLIREHNNSVNESSPLVKKSTPMKRMLEHYTRKRNYSELESVNEMQIVLPNDNLTSDVKEVIQNDGKQNLLKKKIQISVKPSSLKETGLEVPVPKVRRVLPENEGGYKIKMPAGTTERSKKLLEQAKKRKIKTVFDRLGESSVSSTTSEISSATSSNAGISSKNSSVFARLGEKTSVVSSTSSTDDMDSVPPDQLPYAGILKTNSLKKGFPNSKSTMRADEQQKTEMTKQSFKKGISVKKRLGLTKEVDSPDRTILKARRTGGKKSPVLPISNRINSTKLGMKINNYVVESTVSTTKVLDKEKSLKRKLDSSVVSDANTSKKVRFGKITHRLIPSTPSSTDPVSYVKNYPKLTMVINNPTVSSDSVKLSSGIKTGSLNSDQIRQKVGIKARIGNKSVQNRLGNKIGPPSGKKIMRVQDRLG